MIGLVHGLVCRVAIAAVNVRMARLKTLRDTASIAVASPQRRSPRWFIQMYLQRTTKCGASDPGSSNKRIDRGFARSALNCHRVDLPPV